ncbi:MAG: hypothetical protein WEE20_02955, partial [Bacteroidota bacterium]
RRTLNAKSVREARNKMLKTIFLTVIQPFAGFCGRFFSRAERKIRVTKRERPDQRISTPSGNP